MYRRDQDNSRTDRRPALRQQAARTLTQRPPVRPALRQVARTLAQRPPVRPALRQVARTLAQRLPVRPVLRRQVARTVVQRPPVSPERRPRGTLSSYECSRTPPSGSLIRNLRAPT